MPTPLSELYREIPLTQGQVTVVDATDYEWLTQWKWFAIRNTGGAYYAQRNIKIDGKWGSVIQMQRQILGLESGDRRKADHADRDTLNNRRENLRIATHAQNRANSKTSAASGLKGAYYRKDRGRWQGQIRVDKKCISLGFYDSPELAHEAYRVASLEHFGEFSRVGAIDGLRTSTEGTRRL